MHRRTTPLWRIAAVWLCIACSSAACSTNGPELRRDTHETSVAASTGAQPAWAKTTEPLLIASAKPSALEAPGTRRERGRTCALDEPGCALRDRAPTRAPSASRPRDARGEIRRMHAFVWPIADPHIG